MIVKNLADVERWMEQEGKCGRDGSYCSQSCESHGAHLALTSKGKVFARSEKMRRITQLAAAA